jgi:ribose/xylose/arabinose/galactoside ABC-type transport system permease subunit
MNDDQERPASHSRVNAVLEDLESELASEAAAGGPAKERGPLAAILRMRELSVLGATVLLFVVLSLATPLFPAPDNLLLVARQISILAIIATGVTFLFISREIDLSVGSTYGFMVVCLAFLIAKWSVHPWLAILATVALGTSIGFVNGIITTRFGIPSFIVTLGMLSMLRGAALLVSGGWPIIIKLPPEHSFLNITAGRAWGTVPMQVFWMIGLMLIAGFVLGRTRFGAHVYATGGNEEAAILTGIPTRRVKIFCFMMTGGLCGIAAALLLGQVRSGFPLTGVGFELDIIAAVVIGGTPLFGGAGSILGTLLGAAILGMITNGLVLLGASAYFEPVAKGAIIVSAILVDTLIRQRRV